MKKLLTLGSLTLLTLGLLASCVSTGSGSSGSTNPGLRTSDIKPEAPSTWLGKEPHLVLVGTVNGVEFSINITKDDPRIEAITGKRELQELARTKEIRYVAFEIGFGAVMEAIERELEIEFENADFAMPAPKTEYSLLNTSNENQASKGGILGMNTALEMEWEWEDAKKSSFSSGEEKASQGKLIRSMDEGQQIGGWFTANFSNGSLTGSFTTSSTEDEIDTVDSFYL